MERPVMSTEGHTLMHLAESLMDGSMKPNEIVVLGIMNVFMWLPEKRPEFWAELVEKARVDYGEDLDGLLEEFEENYRTLYPRVVEEEAEVDRMRESGELGGPEETAEEAVAELLVQMGMPRELIKAIRDWRKNDRNYNRGEDGVSGGVRREGRGSGGDIH